MRYGCQLYMVQVQNLHIASMPGVCSGVTGGGRVPLTFFIGKFLQTYREKVRQEKKGEWREQEGKLQKGGENLEWKGEKYENEQRLFFHFLKQLNKLFGLYQNGNFYREKAFHAGKKNQGKWLCPPPQKKYIPITPLGVWYLVLRIKQG